MTLLNTGKVLIVSGSESDASNSAPDAESYRNAIWDPKGTTQSSITVQNISYDVFCSGTAALPDGRALVVGGTTNYYPFTGDNRASIFDPATAQFAQTRNMADGRWYANATTLGDGRLMAFSGTNISNGVNNTVEIYDVRNAGAGWSSPVAAPFSPTLFPRMFLLPNGLVFYNGQGDGSNANAWMFDPASETWAQSLATTMDRTYGSAVLLPLLPPGYTPKVMNFGGSNPATATTEIVDLSAASPSWTPGPSMSTGRVEMNATILPNGKVLAQGGSVNNESPDPAGKRADLYDPVANSFSSAGTASYSRLYHSTALLLPDATVVSMGSNPGPNGLYEPAIEIYTPPYLFDANDQPITTNRPGITSISASVVGYNAPFSVTYTSASPISSAVLMRLGSATHAFDMEQRLIGLCGPTPQPSCTGSGTLNLTSPPSGNTAPPGYYMLFLLDSAGVPSIAQFVKLSPYATSPPRGVIASPASDVTIPAGGSVSFGTNSAAAGYGWVFPNGWPGSSTAQNPGNVTFATPGTYVTSLTVTDAAGNSDPSPPTRTITVLPPGADYAIAVAPSSQTVVPGQSANFTVTVTPLSGFNDTTYLDVGSENGFPSGVNNGGFNPPWISGAGGSSTLTINTSSSALPFALSLTIDSAAGSNRHKASATLLINLATPASLTATPGGNQISLTWTASPGATSYHVRRALVSGGPYVSVGCPASTSFNDTGVSNGITYYYVVSAAYTAGPNAGGESSDSTEVSAALSPVQPPSQPTGLTAAPGNARGSISLRWTQSATPNVSQNYIYRRIANGAYSSGPQVTIGATTTYTDTRLTSGATYCYEVTAVNGAGESARSNEACAAAK
jgi:Domain of unknown function (DUF1929)